MNRFLFDALTFLNGVLAMLIIGLGVYVGLRSPSLAYMQPFGLILGTLAGVTLAAAVCGTLAFFALMERHMRTIAEGVQNTNTSFSRESAASYSNRREPSL